MVKDTNVFQIMSIASLLSSFLSNGPFQSFCMICFSCADFQKPKTIPETGFLFCPRLPKSNSFKWFTEFQMLYWCRLFFSRVSGILQTFKANLRNYPLSVYSFKTPNGFLHSCDSFLLYVLCHKLVGWKPISYSVTQNIRFLWHRSESFSDKSDMCQWMASTEQRTDLQPEVWGGFCNCHHQHL